VTVNRKIEIFLIRIAIELTRVRALIQRFRVDSRANVAVMFALSAIPMMGAIGGAIDYTMATSVRTKLQSAADSASLATVSSTATPITTASSMSGSGTVSGGAAYALNFFSANLTTATGYSNLNPTATVTKSGQVITATVSFTANVPTAFLEIMGINNLSVSGTSTSSYTLPTYMNFYLVLDVSGSQGFPSTSSEQNRLEAINPDNYTLYPNGCTFACHFSTQGACPNSEQKYNTNGYCEGFALTRTAGGSGAPVTSCPTPGTSACIQLQGDAVGYAVTQLLLTAYNSEVVTNQFQIGLYPFIEYLYSYFPLTTNINGSSISDAAAQLASLQDTGNNSNLGSGGTHFENALPSINSLITTIGNGSTASKAIPFVFLITDGAQDYQTQWNGTWSGSNQAQLVDTSLCTTIKNRGITLAVLYVPYQLIQNPTNFANGEDYAVNAIIPDIPSTLQSCASPNFYFTASSPEAITSALREMFEQAVNTAHLTN